MLCNWLGCHCQHINHEIGTWSLYVKVVILSPMGSLCHLRHTMCVLNSRKIYTRMTVHALFPTYTLAKFVIILQNVYTFTIARIILPWPRVQAWSKLRPCWANHRPGYWSNQPCDWLSTAWHYSKQETENGPITHNNHCSSSLKLGLLPNQPGSKNLGWLGHLE